MSALLKNIIIAGASGSVGSPILQALLEEPSFNVTILTRSSSSATFPHRTPVIKVSDAYTVSELTEAFRGQDAVVVALTTGAVTKPGDDLSHRLIDAAVAAGVKRFIPSEFAANNLDTKARKLVPVYNTKGAMLEYLIKKSQESNGTLTWTSISCGSWLDWALDPKKSGNFLGIDVKARSATIYDSGLNRYSITTSGNTALAVVRVLLKPESTVNKQVFLTDFVSNTREIISALEKELGEKFSVIEKNAAPVLQDLQAKFDAGDYNSVFGIIKLSFVANLGINYDFPSQYKIWNDELGLPKVTLGQIVHEAVELSKRS